MIDLRALEAGGISKTRLEAAVATMPMSSWAGIRAERDLPEDVHGRIWAPVFRSVGLPPALQWEPASAHGRVAAYVRASITYAEGLAMRSGPGEDFRMTIRTASLPSEEIIQAPVWSRVPSTAELARGYPLGALKAGRSVQVTFDCHVDGEGRLGLCVDVSRTVPLAAWETSLHDVQVVRRYFRLAPPADGTSLEGRRVQVTVDWTFSD